MKMRAPLAVAAGLLVLGLCRPASGAETIELRGQVFVVLQDGAAVKMALSKVYVVTPDAMEKQRRAISEAIKRINQEAEEEIESIRRRTEILRDADTDDSMTRDELERLSERVRNYRLRYQAALVEAAGSVPDRLPPAALADADGRFRLEAPRDHWIVVHAERGEPREAYRWMLRAGEAVVDPGADYLFSNHNWIEVPEGRSAK
jgi:hypothetical protein